MEKTKKGNKNAANNEKIIYDKKLEYISRQFKKAEHKKFEHYVVTRIWHFLNDLEIKFVTQQYVVRPEGRALTDMHFPQLRMYVEIDEGPHKDKINIKYDNIRKSEILDATGHIEYRIDVTKDIETINKNINEIIKIIKERKINVVNFKPWDIDAEQNPLYYIEKGNIHINDNCGFKTAVEAAYCFGKKYKKGGIWGGGVPHPVKKDTLIWFPKLKSKRYPKLFKNNIINNSISINEKTIIERIDPDTKKVSEHINKVIKVGRKYRIVFAQEKSTLGDVMYRFKGVYKLDEKRTKPQIGIVWKRIAEEIETCKTS